MPSFKPLIVFGVAALTSAAAIFVGGALPLRANDQERQDEKDLRMGSNGTTKEDTHHVEMK